MLSPRAQSTDDIAPPTLRLDQVTAKYTSRKSEVVVARDISFEVPVGGCLALVGQSGSGKTTISRVVAGLHAPASGTVALNGKPLAPLSKSRTHVDRRAVQLIFQNPRESLNPRRIVTDSVARTARVLRGTDAKASNQIARDLFDRVRLPSNLRNRFPEELSGGQLQRVAIARALAGDPALLVCDEVTSALDVSVQATVLELLDELRTDLNLSLLFITHDLGVVAAIAQRVIVLDRGDIVEDGPVEDVLLRPQDPYTQALLAAAPSISTILATKKAS